MVPPPIMAGNSRRICAKIRKIGEEGGVTMIVGGRIDILNFVVTQLLLAPL